MRKFAVVFTSLFLLISCHQKPNLRQQLNIYLGDHLKKLDSSIVLDSINIARNIPVNEKLGRIIDDSIYMREYARLKMQLANAAEKKEKDSIEYYQYEINYMNTELDSIGKLITTADTNSNFGRLINCAIFIRKKEKSKRDSFFVFIDSTSVIRFSPLMDSALKKDMSNM